MRGWLRGMRGDLRLDRKIVLWGLKSLLEERTVPENTKVVRWAETKWVQKEFRLKELPERWEAFCRKAASNGESLTGFFRTVQKVEVHDGGLLLFLKDESMRNGPVNGKIAWLSRM